MVVIKKDGAQVFHSMPNNSSHSEYEIIWPLNDTLLDLYLPETLNKMISFSSDAEKFTVSLAIKLAGKLGTHTVRKEYRIKNLSDTLSGGREANGICWIMEKSFAPFWSIWPYANISGDAGQWKLYNCFCIEDKRKDVHALEILPVSADGSELTSRAQPLSIVGDRVRNFYYKRYDTLPTAFKVREKTEHQPIPYGIVFLAKPETDITLSSSLVWNVGIDFGTTSTTAFYTTPSSSTPKFIHLLNEYEWKKGIDTPKVTEYENDFKMLCNNGDDVYKKYFIDDKCFKQDGYVTTLEEMDDSSGALDETIFSKHRIFWHNYDNFRYVNRVDEGRRGRLKTNIKWDTETIYSKIYLNQLLTQIVHQAGKERVGTIRFFFSYPSAIGPGKEATFRGNLRSIIDRLRDDTGINTVFNADKKNDFLTESIAAAYFFNFDPDNKLQSVFFCVDIGGGSTDISLWLETKNFFQSSIHFASRDMFIAPLKRLVRIPSILREIATEQSSDRINIMLKNRNGELNMDDDSFNLFIETVLFEYEPLLKEDRLDCLKSKHDKKAYETFKCCVLIAYSGLMYYLANIISSLYNSKDEKRKIPAGGKDIVFGLSGKGSKLTTWIDAYIEYVYGEAEKLIKEKTGLTKELIPQFKKDTAKTETAQGMIRNLDPDGKQKDKTELSEPDVYMGSDITLSLEDKTKKFSKDQFVDVTNDDFFSAASLSKLTIELDKELKELDTFIEFYNKIASKTHNEMPSIQSDVFNSQRANFADKIEKLFRTNMKEGRFEPPFIVILKGFVAVYSEEYLWKSLKQN
jgi:hypothetical protein